MGALVVAGLENIAETMGCSRKTLYKWIKGRDFPAFKMDGVWRATPREMEAWLNGQRGAQPPRTGVFEVEPPVMGVTKAA